VDVAQHEFTVPNPRNMRGKVEALQKAISKHAQYEPETKHTFHGGMYCREVCSAQGALIVGKVHKQEHFFMLLSGSIIVTEGDNAKSVTAPCILNSKPGTKRAIFMVEPSVFATVHRTDTTTVEDAENELVEFDPDAMFDVGNIAKPQDVGAISWRS